MLDRNAIGSIRTTNIKGKEYAEVNSRVLAFYEGCPGGSIRTRPLFPELTLPNGWVLIEAQIRDEDDNIISTGLAYETQGSSTINKTSYIENCETSAVGRALGFAGIGINGSICSAEELQNALKQQEKQQKDSDRRNELYFAKKRLTTAVKEVCKRDGRDYNEYVKAVKARSDYDENDVETILRIAEEVEQS